MVTALGTHDAEAARAKKHTRAPAPDRSAHIVIEASTGYVLNARNPDKQLYPASLTKLMTLYLTFDALEEGRLGKRQRVSVSKRAAAQEPSSLGLRPGETIRVEDAILAIATKSANDCAVVLAEAVGGSEDRFAKLMTMKARQLGMNHTRFVNASGLFKPAQVSTARDMAILSKALIDDHPQYYRYFSTESFTYEGNAYQNHNKLMNSYQGMDGLKTGYVYASGYNLAASAVRSGTRLIGVVFGGKTTRSRNNTMAQLLDRGFADITQIRVASLSPKQKLKPVTAQRKQIVIPDTPEAADSIVTAAGSESTSAVQIPQFDAMGLVMDQGDTDIRDDRLPKNFLAEFRPRPVDTAATASAARSGDWAIQVGAFASHAAGTKALDFAKKSLRGTVSGTDSIAPLMTNRGMVYRARLSGLAHNDAAQACRILKGNCLVLTVD